MAGSLDDSIYNNGRVGGGGGVGFKLSRGFNKDSISKRIIMMLFFSKGIRAWSCIILLYFLQSSISIISLSFYMCLFSSISSVLVEKPWNLLSSLRPSQIKKIIYHSIFNLLIVIAFNSSIKFIGPIGSILASDYTFSTYPLIFNSLLQGNFLATDMSRGSIMLMIGYFLIPLFGINSRLDILGYSSSQVFMIGLFSLIVHNVLVLWKKTIVRGWNSGSGVGGKNKLSSLGSCLSTVVLLVFKLFEGWGNSSSMTIDQVSYSQLFVIAIITLILYSLNQFIDDVSEKELTFNVLSKVSLTSSILFGLLAALFIGFKDFFHPILILSFIFIINAIHILYSKSNDIQPMTFSNNMDGSNSNIKTYNSGGNGGSMINNGNGGNAVYYFEILKDVLRQIVDKPTSRRIFTFLVINLMFMFVEMAYGIWTNSLGLITDACHMFFDATALFIALVAEVISQWKQNDKYSYGYGRFQVLSGFVNGIFLIFIAVTILMESIERLLEPPEINTDKLLLVSVLGFIINLIGIFSFHGDHGHSHGGGGGHSHGGEKKEKHHGHSHGGHGGHSDQVTPILGEEKKKKRSVNIDGVFLHLLADTLGSVGVIVSSLIIQIWGYTLADPICSLLISILIFLSVLPLIANTAKTLLQCTPEPIQSSLDQINQYILSVEGVHNIISYHFWSHYDDMNIATLKIQLNEAASSNSSFNTEKIKKSISKYLNKDHNIHKCIIEFIPLLYNNQQGNDVPLISHVHNDIHSSSSSSHHRHN
ncbi:hypothetical protein RB653_009618 [Dictyostelium firmibasis]|uniref:Zinc transporter n=1 Tax=Dictyostelium firmibasis TaxID=79012 RepID=A0AAN7TUJ4_9MYCE